MKNKSAKKKPLKHAAKARPSAASLVKLDPASAVRELATVRDFIRFAVSKFRRAGLTFGHGTHSAFDEAVFLVLESLQLPIEQLEPYYDARLLPAERKLLADTIEQRVTTKKPLAYILKKTYLRGVPFYVDERVIVPRSYISDLLFTDILGNEGFSLISDPMSVGSVLDLCTGSGCLAVLAAMLFPNATVDAVDLSKEALEVAKINVKESGMEDRITLFHGDLFSPLKGRKYDFIITNPPYVDADLMVDLPREYQHEPRMALAVEGHEDGLDIVRRILAEAPRHLTQEGRLVCEIGYGRENLEAEYDNLPFLWLDTENSEGEVFWLTRDQMNVRA